MIYGEVETTPFHHHYEKNILRGREAKEIAGRNADQRSDRNTDRNSDRNSYLESLDF